MSGVFINGENYLIRGNKFHKDHTKQCNALQVSKKKKKRKTKKSKKEFSCKDSNPKFPISGHSDYKDKIMTKADSKSNEQQNLSLPNIEHVVENQACKSSLPSAVKCNSFVKDVIQIKAKIHQGDKTESRPIYYIYRQKQELSWRSRGDSFSFHSSVESRSAYHSSVIKQSVEFRFEGATSLFTRLFRQKMLTNFLATANLLANRISKINSESPLRFY